MGRFGFTNYVYSIFDLVVANNAFTPAKTLCRFDIEQTLLRVFAFFYYHVIMRPPYFYR